jgi:hypothetical protein
MPNGSWYYGLSPCVPTLYVAVARRANTGAFLVPVRAPGIRDPMDTGSRGATGQRSRFLDEVRPASNDMRTDG